MSRDGYICILYADSMCDWNGHSWGDCPHDEAEPCDCAVGPCRYCGKTHEEAAARSVEFARELEAER